MTKVAINSTAVDVIAALPDILRLDSSAVFWFVRYDPKPGIRERTKSTPDEETRVAALLEQSDISKSDFFGIRAADLTPERLVNEITNTERDNRSFAINSPVSWGSLVNHIPMMDFRCDANDTALTILTRAMAKVDIPGLILKSGKSYHFYGTRLLNEAQWRTFLGQCMLLGDVADFRYAGHCLIRGMCTLRISRHPTLHSMPTVVVSEA